MVVKFLWLLRLLWLLWLGKKAGKLNHKNESYKKISKKFAQSKGVCPLMLFGGLTKQVYLSHCQKVIFIPDHH
jgi:hypothetical protein